MDAYAKKGVSMKDFKPLGRFAFSVVSIANGWANNFSKDLIRYDSEPEKGDATHLKFDWPRDELVKFLNDPELDINQKGNPLVHVYCPKFIIAHEDHPEKCLSVMATKQIKGKADLEKMVGLEANPLEAMLGKRVANAE